MNTNLLRTAAQNGAQRIPQCLACAVGVMFLQLDASAIPSTVPLGTAGDFTVLAGAGITITGPSTITGDIGTFPTTTITGIGNLTLNGVDHAGDAVTQLAKNDLVTAYNNAFGRPADATYANAFDLVGLTLNAGVYNGPTSLFLSGTLTLDAQNNPDAVWIFQAGSTLITASGSTVALIGGAQACNVFWQVGSSATLGTDTDFVGNILALESITLNTGAAVDGRVMARNGAVTMDNNNTIKSDCHDDDDGDDDDTGGTAVPDAGSTLLLLSSGFGALVAARRRFFRQV